MTNTGASWSMWLGSGPGSGAVIAPPPRRCRRPAEGRGSCFLWCCASAAPGEQLSPRVARADGLAVRRQGLPGLLVERLGHDHLDGDEQVTPAAVPLAHALAADPEGPAVG